MWFCDELKYYMKYLKKSVHQNRISVDIGSLCILIQ